jgi:hypothetical protein
MSVLATQQTAAAFTIAAAHKCGSAIYSLIVRSRACIMYCTVDATLLLQALLLQGVVYVLCEVLTVCVMTTSVT